MIAAFAFVCGAVSGSFLSVVAHRLPRGESFISGRSRCPRCGVTIAAKDNIPIVSWLLVRGRCRSCAAPISPRYPLIEFGTGLAFMGVALVHLEGERGLATGPDAFGLAAGLVFVSILAAVTLTDLDLRVIPNRLLIAGAVLGLPLVVAADPSSSAERAVAAAAAGGGLLIVALAYPRGMGMGDVKLAALMGAYLGDAVAPAILVGFLAGSIVGVALLLRHGSAARKAAVPFGPFLALGGLAGLLAGEAMVDWYVETFFSG